MTLFFCQFDISLDFSLGTKCLLVTRDTTGRLRQVERTQYPGSMLPEKELSCEQLTWTKFGSFKNSWAARSVFAELPPRRQLCSSTPICCCPLSSVPMIAWYVFLVRRICGRCLLTCWSNSCMRSIIRLTWSWFKLVNSSLISSTLPTTML